MPEFGSFSLLLALVLSGYTLLAGGVALRQLATGSRGRMAPDRLAETARRAGIGSFFAVTCAAFALVYTAFANDFSVSYIALCPVPTSLPRYGRARRDRCCFGPGC
jgi:cytochrome c-type biogenesis protein CcmF